MYTYVYIRTCFVLIHPPIPYIMFSRCKRLHKFRPETFLLHKRTNTRSPPCNDLNNFFFKIYEVITSIFFKIFFIKFMKYMYVCVCVYIYIVCPPSSYLKISRILKKAYIDLNRPWLHIYIGGEEGFCFSAVWIPCSWCRDNLFPRLPTRN